MIDFNNLPAQLAIHQLALLLPFSTELRQLTDHFIPERELALAQCIV